VNALKTPPSAPSASSAVQPKAPKCPRSERGAKALLSRFSRLDAALAASDAKLEKRIAELREKHTSRTASRRTRRGAMVDALIAFIEANKALFEKPRSRSYPGIGTLGIRLGQRTLELAESGSWEEVLELLMDAANGSDEMDQFLVHPPMEINRAALLAKATTEQLVSLGLHIVQTERAFVKTCTQPGTRETTPIESEVAK